MVLCRDASEGKRVRVIVLYDELHLEYRSGTYCWIRARW